MVRRGKKTWRIDIYTGKPAVVFCSPKPKPRRNPSKPSSSIISGGGCFTYSSEGGGGGERGARTSDML